HPISRSSTYCSVHPPDTHSFPTRRSSDLVRSRDDVVDTRVITGAFRRHDSGIASRGAVRFEIDAIEASPIGYACDGWGVQLAVEDRKSTRLNSSHVKISYAVFCLKKKNQT